jgi:hypothetical protein
METKDKIRITAAEMGFRRQMVKFTWMGYKRNEDIIKIESIMDKMSKYKSKWIQHVNRMQRGGLPKLLKNYKPHRL